MNNLIYSKLKPEIEISSIETVNDILELANANYLTGDNAKYMKMYNRLSVGYDFAESVFGKLMYGDKIIKMREQIYSKIEWKNYAKILVVSIGTGKDLNFIPKSVDPATLDITGADISIGMLQRCQKNFYKKMNLALVHCCAEDLPFADEQFDIVFHFGGINFFSDKQRGITEMLRVAKKGTKIMIGDETGDFVAKQYKKNIFTKKYYKDAAFNLEDIEKLIPETIKEKQTDLYWNNTFYSITFRK